MNEVISNSSPLILLAKIRKLSYLFSLFEYIIIPPEVFNEVIKQGLENNHPDAIQLEENYKKGVIKVKKPRIIYESLEKNKNLHLGEIEALSLAIESKNSVILLDDEEARIFARKMGITVKGTLGILVENYNKQLITQKEAIDSLGKLNEIMYLSGEVFEFILQKLNN
jgi:predicted nucleic acid-binding protein